MGTRHCTRLWHAIVFGGGVSSGRTSTDRCDVVAKVDNPSPLYCHTAQPFWAPSVKFLASYPLPSRFEAAATFQSIPGLGDSTKPPTVHVRWPDGRVEEWRGVAIDRDTTLKEGAGTPAADVAR